MNADKTNLKTGPLTSYPPNLIRVYPRKFRGESFRSDQCPAPSLLYPRQAPAGFQF